jgi:DNA-binding NarL/FixJ family response regulator
MDKQKKAIVSSSIAHLKALQNPESGAGDPAVPSNFEQACKLHHLTSREVEIVDLIHKGLSYKRLGKPCF